MTRYLLIFLTVLTTACFQEASAFWGDNRQGSASGLDAGGFDINTITTVYGTVTEPPVARPRGQHAEMTLATPQGPLVAVLGPWWFWEKQSAAIPVNQPVTVTGSMAQGKNGVSYMFTQKILLTHSGTLITLRSETGRPLWSRSGPDNGGAAPGNRGRAHRNRDTQSDR